MCGICGIFHYKNPRPIDETLIRRMTRVMAHRGPDDNGYFLSKQHNAERGRKEKNNCMTCPDASLPEVGFGHCRLSIIDLSTGHQPISNENDSVWLIINGEIYNFPALRQELEHTGHTFKTRSDAEVILHLYEDEDTRCVEQLNGIFALALWDGHRQRLVLARDHLGVKPLYYYDDGSRLIFASELKAILEVPGVPRLIEPVALDNLLTFRYVPAPLTLLAGIKKLSPGHRLICTRNGCMIEPYWTYAPEINYRKRERDFVEEYRAQLIRAVHDQMISDVPLGTLLSGGVDSGTIVALMSELKNHPKTFTIGFAGAEAINELAEAQQIAQLFKTEHHEKIIGEKEYTDFLPRALWHLEEPVGTTSALALYFICEVVKDYVKVVLTGQGADEPLAGYDRYKGEKYATLYQKIPSFIRSQLIRPLIEALPGQEKLKRGVRSLGVSDLSERFIKIYEVFTREMKSNLYNKKMFNAISGNNPTDVVQPFMQRVQHLDHLAQMLYLDTRLWLPNDLLLVGDKMSMAHSVEMRVPYLDIRLIEFIETIPSIYKLKGLTGKYIHKKAVTKWLPKSIINRPKKGFPTPMEYWLRTPDFVKYVRESLSKSPFIKENFNIDFISQLIQQHQSGRETYTRQLFLLLSLELWHRIFIQKQIF